MRHVEKIVKLNFNNVIHKTCIMKQQGFIRRWAVCIPDSYIQGHSISGK